LHEELDLLKIVLVYIDWKMVNYFRAGTAFQLETSFTFENNVVSNTVLYETIRDIVSVIENLVICLTSTSKLRMLKRDRGFFQFQRLWSDLFSLDGICG